MDANDNRKTVAAIVTWSIHRSHAENIVSRLRTLLTTSVIDAVMTSRYEGGRLIETPHLDVA
jgi:hypothetical protein